MPRKNKDESDSEGSSESEGQVQDLNQMLSETQRKITEEHHRMAQNAFKEGQEVVADIKQRYQHAISVTQKNELNELHKKLTASLNSENTKLFELVQRFKEYSQQFEEKIQDLFQVWSENNEDCKNVGDGCERAIERSIKDEIKGYENFKTIIGFKDTKLQKESRDG